MTVDFMKWVDRWAGGLGCFLMDVLDRLRRLWSRRRGRLEDVRTVLITKYMGMGSLVLATPMVAQVRARFPGARILFLTFDENREIAELLGVFDEVITIRSKRLGPLVGDTAAALWRCWRTGVDVVFDLEFFTRYSTLVAYLSGAPNRVGFWSRIAWRGDLLTHPVYYNGTKHIARVFIALGEAAGQPWDGGDLGAALAKLPEDPPASAALDALLRRQGLDPARPLLLVNPNASALCLERRWMPQRFAWVVDQLQAARPELQAVFLGGSGEAAFTAQVAGLCGGGDRANLAGLLGLRELMALLRRGRVFLTNDSGPLHLATLVDTPTVALFGPETPTLYGPLGPRQRAFYAGVYCSPCLNVFNSKTAPCHGNNICMQALEQETVLQACRELLGPA